MIKEGNNAVAVAVAAVDLSVVAALVDHLEEVLVASTKTIVVRLLKIQKTISPCVRYVTRKSIQHRSVSIGLKKTMWRSPPRVFLAVRVCLWDFVDNLGITYEFFVSHF